MAAGVLRRVTVAHAQPRVMAADILLPATVAAMRRPAVTVVVDPPTVAAAGRMVAVAAADMDVDIDITPGLFPA